MQTVNPIHDTQLDYYILAGETQASCFAASGGGVITPTRTGTVHQASQLLSGSGASTSHIKKFVMSFATEMIDGNVRRLGARLRVRINDIQKEIPTDVGAGLIQ